MFYNTRSSHAFWTQEVFGLWFGLSTLERQFYLDPWGQFFRHDSWDKKPWILTRKLVAEVKKTTRISKGRDAWVIGNPMRIPSSMFFHRTQNGDTSHSNSGGTRGYFLGRWDCKRLMFDVESLKRGSSERGQPQLFPAIVWGETHLGMDQSQNLAIRWPPPYNLFWWHSWDFHEGIPKHTIINRPIMINNDHNLVHIQNIQNIQLVS